MKMPTFFASGDTPERHLIEGDYIRLKNDEINPVPELLKGFEDLYAIVQKVHLRDSIVKTRAPRTGHISVAFAYFMDEGIIVQEDTDTEDAINEDTLPENPMELHFRYFHVPASAFRRVPPEDIPPEIPLLFAHVDIAKPGDAKPDNEPDAPVPTPPGKGGPPSLPPNADALTVPDELPPPDLVSKTQVA